LEILTITPLFDAVDTLFPAFAVSVLDDCPRLDTLVPVALEEALL